MARPSRLRVRPLPGREAPGGRFVANAGLKVERLALDVIRIGICQLQSDIGHDEYDPRPANLERARTALEDAASRGARLVVFGEVFLNGYGSGPLAHRYAVAERDDDPWIRRLVDEARRHEAHVLVGATTHKGSFPGDVYNSVLAIGPNGLLGVYNKTHLASFSSPTGRVVAEAAYWSPGSELRVFETPLGRIGVEICYDIAFPEVPRALALRGAELIVSVSAAVSGSEEYWDHILFVRAFENRVWYVHVSIVGHQENLAFFGGSRLVSPCGECVAAAPHGREAVVVAEARMPALIEARGRSHVFHNRNPLLYRPITEPYTPDGNSCSESEPHREPAPRREAHGEP